MDVYSPSLHGTGDASVMGHFEPMGQLVHDVAPLGAYCPVPQSAGVLVPSVGQALPAGQVVQLVEPAAPAYWPGGHAWWEIDTEYYMNIT